MIFIFWGIFIFNTGKCPSGWHHYEKTSSCYKVYLRSENYWQAVETCQKVNGSLATFGTNEELQFILKIEVDFDEKVCERKDQCKWVWESVFGGRGERLWFWVLNAGDVLCSAGSGWDISMWLPTRIIRSRAVGKWHIKVGIQLKLF